MISERLLYSPVEAAEVLGISRSKVYLLLKDGQLDSVHIGRSRRISRDHVFNFVKGLPNA